MHSSSTAAPAPHSKIRAKSKSESVALALFDRLWDRYRERVSYVNVYEVRKYTHVYSLVAFLPPSSLSRTHTRTHTNIHTIHARFTSMQIQGIVASYGATFFNDHIALRSLALQVILKILTFARIHAACMYLNLHQAHVNAQISKITSLLHDQFPIKYNTNVYLYVCIVILYFASVRTRCLCIDPEYEHCLVCMCVRDCVGAVCMPATAPFSEQIESSTLPCIPRLHNPSLSLTD
jgi:hypothetical protein